VTLAEEISDARWRMSFEPMERNGEGWMLKRIVGNIPDR